MEKNLRHYKTFRYEVSSEIQSADTVLYVLHGYGQLAQYFIRKFRPLFEDLLIVAPEGMHRFYLNGSSGRVGASWMTKEAREDDISDNIAWLNRLDEEISERYAPKRKVLLGFSQGGATAARWFHKGNIAFDALVLWACVFPPDLNPEDEIRNCTEEYFVIGTEDEYYNTASQQELFDFYQKKGFKNYQFTGKHDIDAETLLRILNEINDLKTNG